MEDNDFSAHKIQKLSSKNDWLDEIATKLLEVNPQKLFCLLQQLNSKYEHAHLSQMFLSQILPKISDVSEIQKACTDFNFNSML